MKDLLEYLVKKIVKNEDAARVSEEVSGEFVTENLEVDPTEAGLVIGKGGRTIKSLRGILRVLAIQKGQRVDIRLQNGIDENSLTNPLSGNVPGTV